MAELTMENPLASQPQLNKVAQDTIDCIMVLKREFDETKTPVNDDNQTLHRFCAKLEHLLKAEMKEKTTLLGRRKEYYDFFCDCLSTTKGLNDGIKFVKSTGEYKTSTGRGRAFIRFCLVHQRLADTIQQCVMNGRVTSDWYTVRSVWLNHIQKNTIITALYELNDINFDLLPRGYDLDSAWPSFSRITHGLGVPQGNWNPPSRASSYTSIVSLPGQEPVFTRERRDTTSTTVSEAEYDQMTHDLSISEGEKSQLSLRVEELEQENVNIAEAITAKEQDLTEREAELAKVMERCRMLEAEMGLKEKVWEEKEAHFKSETLSCNKKIKTLEDKIDQLREELLTNEKSFIRREDDYKKQFQERENRVVQLEVELKSTQQVTDSVRELLKTQEQAVSSLQTKLSCQEGKNEELLHKMEAMVLNKDSEVGSQLDTAGKLHAMLDNLKTSEQENVELRSKLEESSRKCDDLEANLAQFEELQKTSLEELNTVKSSLKASQSKEAENALQVQQLQSKLTTAQSHNEQLSEKLTENSAAIENLTGEVADVKRQNSKITQQLKEQEEKHDSVKKLLENTEGLNEKLRENQTQLTEELNAKDSSIVQLRSELDTARSQAEETEGQTSAYRTMVSQLADVLEGSLTDKDLTQMVNLIPDENTRKTLKLFKERLDSKRASAEETNQKLLSLEEEMVHLKEENSEQGRQLQSEQQAVEQLREMNKFLQNLETDARSRSEKDSSLLQMKDNQIQGLEEQMKQKEDTVSELRSELVSKAENITKKNQEMAEMRASAQKIQEQLQTSLKSKEITDQEFTSIIEKCNVLESNLHSEKKKTEMLEAQKAKLSEELQKANSSLKDSQEHLEHLKESSAAEKQVIVKILEEQVSELQLKFEQEQSERLSLLDNEAKLQKQVETSQIENVSLSSKFETLSCELQEVRDQLTCVQQECVSKDTQIGSLVAENEAVTNKTKQLEEQLKLESQTKHEYAEKITEKDETIAELEKVADELKLIGSSSGDKLQHVQETFEKYKLKQTELMENKEESIKKLESEIETWKLGVENEKEASVILRGEREELKARVEKLNREKEECGQEIASLQTSLKEEEELVKVTKLQAEGDKQALQNQVEDQEQEIQALKFQLSSQHLQHEQALGKYADHEFDISSMRDRLSEQEGLIEQMEGEMWAIKQAREEEQRQQKQELEDVKYVLQTKDEEFKLLSSKLVQISTKLADAENQVSILEHKAELKENLEKLLQQSREESSAAKKENSILKGDIVQLKKKLIRLIREKDALWQKTDSLVYEQRVHATEKWIEDSEVHNCMGCRIEFSFTTRKHHCRQCGRIFCWNCSNNWVMTTHSNKKARVCNGCYIKQRDVDGKADSPLVGNDSDDDEAGLSGSMHGRSAISEDRMSQSSASQDGATTSSLDISGLVSGDTDSLTSTDLREVDSPDYMAGDESRYSGNETDDNKQGRQPSEAASNNMTSSLMITVEDLQKGHVNRDNEVWLKAGRRFSVPILIDSVGVVLCWEFTTQPKDIGFSATYGEQETTPSHEAQVLIEPCKCNSHKQAVRGELTAKKKGVYTLMFDNSYSKLTAKKLSYSLYVKSSK
ncbi:FYVE and coiled-coil domain-containing protein 1-like isoform X2 [Liolophura sinensis]|uniref:FYVE and coiled-coil domain-containing protein 1-like isoform X2 n=1 Tax=Liolophura sinensis TaxID=3198878 RepID=UPI003158DA0D